MSALASGLSEAVGDGEDLARFLTIPGLFNSKMAKPAAFLPNPRDRERSVFRHDAEPREGLWRIAREHVVKGGQALYGAAVVKAGRAREVSLEVLASEPPPRHAAIVGWPWPDDPDLRKAQQLEKAAFLSQHSQLMLV